MKNIMAAAVAEKIGDEITEKFLVTKVTETNTREGRQWLSFILKDISGTISAKMWPEKMIAGENYPALEGQVCTVKGVVDLYDGKADLIIDEITECQEYDNSDFCECLSKERLAERQDHAKELIGMIKDEKLRCLVTKTYNSVFRIMCGVPAVKERYYAYNGGLVEHTLEVCDIAVSMCDMHERYGKSYSTGIDRDLVIAAALLHGIGVVADLTSFPSCEYTERGVLLSAPVESIRCIERMNMSLSKEVQIPAAELARLEHCILSAYGSDVKAPCIKEAVLLKNADMASAEMDAFDTALKADTDKPRVWNKFSGSWAVRKEEKDEYSN